MKQGTYQKIESALGRKMRNILVYWHYPEILTLPHTKTFSDEIHLAFAIDWIKNAFHTSHEEGIPRFTTCWIIPGDSLTGKQRGISYRPFSITMP